MGWPGPGAACSSGLGWGEGDGLWLLEVVPLRGLSAPASALPAACLGLSAGSVIARRGWLLGCPAWGVCTAAELAALAEVLPSVQAQAVAAGFRPLLVAGRGCRPSW